MHSKSFPESNSRATAAFQLVHTDLKSFPVESYSKYRYFISFLDDYTSHAWIVLLRRKSDAIDATRHFNAMVKTQFSTSVKEFQMDSGGEYKSHDFDNMLKDLGIKVRTSVPYVHQQNGRAERFNRTVMDKSEAIRHDACLPPSWWEFAVLHAVYLYNCTPVRCLQWRTPFELINGEIPNVTNLRIFGCGAYVYLPEDVRQNKLAPKAELMVFLGFPAGTKGFLFMRLHNNSLFTGATATFDEAMFPKCPKQTKMRLHL